MTTSPWCLAAVAGVVAIASACSGSVTTEPSAASSPPDPSTVESVRRQPATSEPTSTTTLSDPTDEPSRPPIVLGFAGDTSFTNGNDQLDPLSGVAELLMAPDLMVLNLETAVADAGVGRPPVQKRFLFRSPPAALDLLTEVGVDVVTLANNHTLDFGPDALAQTLAELEARSLMRAGGGLDEDESYQPLILEVAGWRVGLVAFSRVPCDWSASGENTRPEVAWACPALVEAADASVRDAVADADVVVVMVHGGAEGDLCPSGFMEELNERWADLGADLVVNGHPHVLQGFTSVDRPGRSPTMVLRSIGNFAFPSARGITGNSGILTVTVTSPEAPTTGARPDLDLVFTPVRSDSGVLRTVEGAEFGAIIEQVNRVSDGWLLDHDGRLRPAPEQISGC